jgi:hypothetical protein
VRRFMAAPPTVSEGEALETVMDAIGRSPVRAVAVRDAATLRRLCQPREPDELFMIRERGNGLTRARA